MCDLNELKTWIAVFLVLFCVRARCEVEVESLDVPEWATPGVVAISCGWRLQNERLQSLKLLADGQELFQYRGGEYLNRTLLGTEVQTSSCSGPIWHEQGEEAARGRCTLALWLDPLHPRPRTFTCEVSGERPRFQIDNATKTLHIFVSVRETRLSRERGVVGGLVTLNCSTSAAVPSPLITWTLDDEPMRGEKEVSVWNAAAGGWETWSILRLVEERLQTKIFRAVCTPNQHLGDKVISSTPAELMLFRSAATDIRAPVLPFVVFALLRLIGI